MNNLCVYFWVIKACSIFFWISCWRRYDFKNELGQWMENIQSCRIWQIVFLSIFIISNTIHVQNHCIRGLMILLMEVLLIMLSTIGFSGESILLLRSYLVDRLSSDHEETNFQLILSGVPHGAVLRPLISLINISQFEKFNKLNLFAYVRWWLLFNWKYSGFKCQDYKRYSCFSNYGQSTFYDVESQEIEIPNVWQWVRYWAFLEKPEVQYWRRLCEV